MKDEVSAKLAAAAIGEMEQMRPNHSMKPTAPLRNKFRMLPRHPGYPSAIRVIAFTHSRRNVVQC
jgi:hypothetical protein